jgi:integral membrane protein (TIGR01906 family)
VFILRQAAAVLFVAFIPIFIVLTVVRVAANWEVPYGYSYSQYDAPEVTGVERAELDRATTEIIEYFQSTPSTVLLDIRVREGDSDELQPLFNQREVLHMHDVQYLFRWVFRAHEMIFMYLIAYITGVYLWSRERSMRRLAQQAIVGGTATVALLGVTAVAIVMGFDSLWTQFHLISFSNDLWQLDPASDRLIQMFPEAFWFDATLAIGVVSMLIGGVIAVGNVLYVGWLDRQQRQRRRRRRRRPDTTAPNLRPL